MPCSDGPQFALPLILLYLFFMLHSPPVNPDEQLNYLWNYCPTDANYTTNSTFETNLNLLLSRLFLTAIPTGFANETKGQPPDQVYGLGLCRGDVSPAKCRSCLKTSTRAIIKRCPYGMSSVIWYEGCLLRYSYQRFFSTANTSFYHYLVGSQVSDPETFDKFLGQMMYNLTTTAANVSKEMFASAVAEFKNSSTLYALVQCTRDLPHDECYRCLKEFVGIIPNGKSGARVFGFSCYLRYEFYPFFNASTAIIWQPPPVSPPPPVSSPPPVSPPLPVSSPPPVSPSPDSEAKCRTPIANAASGVKRRRSRFKQKMMKA